MSQLCYSDVRSNLAIAYAVAHLNSHIAFLTPASSPRVFDNPVTLGSLLAITHNSYCVINRPSAEIRIDYASLVVPKYLIVCRHSYCHWILLHDFDED